MRTPFPATAVAVIGLLISAGTSLADTPSATTPKPSATAPAEPAAALPDTASLKRATSPMMLEVRAALDREREQIATLRARLMTKPDAREALALQREIERVKLDTEATLLRIQAGAARRAGHAALAERLEIAARDLLAPPTATATAARSTPRAGDR